MRRRRRGSSGGLSRRKLLLGVGAGLTGAGLVPSGAYDSVNAFRGSNVEMASDTNAIIGIDTQDSVQKNSRDPLTYITNNTGEDVSVTLSLKDCNDGTLYDPQGDSGCTVTATIGTGNTGQFDIEAAVSGKYVDFTIDVSSPSFSLSTDDRTYAEAGQDKSGTWVKKLQGLTARESKNDWTVKDVKVEDVEGADNLDRVEFEITESDGTTVGTYTADCSDGSVDCMGGSKYQPNGNPAVEIEPDDSSYTVDSSLTYTLTVTGYDKDGNSGSDTIQN